MTFSQNVEFENTFKSVSLPQGRHDGPIKVKFGVKECTTGIGSVANFRSDG